MAAKIERVIQALRNPNYDSRSVEGIATDLLIPTADVRTALKALGPDVTEVEKKVTRRFYRLADNS